MDIIPEKIICFNITKSLRDWDRGSIYECTRKYWRMSRKKAEQADYCLGVSNGKVLAVYRPIAWFVVEDGEYKGRLMFEGKSLDDSPFIGQDYSNVFSHTQNPVRYIGNWI